VLASVALYATADKACEEELKKFAHCATDEARSRLEDEHKDADEKNHPELNKCFSDNGCTPPDFSAPLEADLKDDKAKANWKSVSDWWDSVDSDKRHCVIKEVRGDFKEKLNECIKRKIPAFEVPGESRDNHPDTADEKDKKKRLASHRFHIRNALRKCDGKQKEVRECLKKARAETVEKRSCELRKKCATDLTKPCQDAWHNSFKQPICSCVSEVAETLRKEADSGAIAKGDEAIKAQCHVEIPKVDVDEVKKSGELHKRIKDYVSLFEDRVVPFCHDCNGIPV
jgi:hypothetical protein